MCAAASNTVTSWMPSNYHGTTLYDMLEGPEKRMGYEVRPDGGINTGFSFVVSKMIRNAVKQGKQAQKRVRVVRAGGDHVGLLRRGDDGARAAGSAVAGSRRQTARPAAISVSVTMIAIVITGLRGWKEDDVRL